MIEGFKFPVFVKNQIFVKHPNFVKHYMFANNDIFAKTSFFRKAFDHENESRNSSGSQARELILTWLEGIPGALKGLISLFRGP